MIRKIISAVFIGLNPFSRVERRGQKIAKPFRQKRKYQRYTYREFRKQPFTSKQQTKRQNVKKKALSEAALKEAIEDLPIVKVIHIIDGDTVIISDGWRETNIRLDSIDCPEDGQPWGDIARYGLIKLIGGRKVLLERHGLDSYGRVLATVYVQHECEWLNVNERMVTLGHAWVMRKFYDHLPRDRQDKLNRLERWARSKRVGLWRAPDPVPPWKWRNGNNGR